MFPCLIDEKLCKIPITAIIKSEELDEDGNAIKYEYKGFCNYQSSGKTIFTNEQKIVQLVGKCYIPGDVFPELSELTGGTVEIFNVKRRIQNGSKCRNIDGSVNFVLLEVI